VLTLTGTPTLCSYWHHAHRGPCDPRSHSSCWGLHLLIVEPAAAGTTGTQALPPEIPFQSLNSDPGKEKVI